MTTLLEKERGTFANRSYYDDDGDLVCVTEAQDVSALLDFNKYRRDEYRAHSGKEMQTVASIPVTLFYKWIVDEGLPGWATAENIDYIINKKLKDPENKYLLTVPENYRI